MSPAPPVAFSLAGPLRSAMALLRGRPGLLVIVILLALAQLAVLAEGVAWVLREGGADALERWRGGSQPERAGALVSEPVSGDTWRLLALGELIVACCAAVAAAGATAAAAARLPVRRAFAGWPVYFTGFLLQLTAAAALLAATLVLADQAGDVRFQLTDAVAVAGTLGITAVLARTALWPVHAAQGAGLLAAGRASWRQTAGDAVRVTLAGVLLLAAVVLPTLMLSVAVRAGLSALERGEQLTWSPQTIDLVALAPWILALPVAALVIAAGTHTLTRALSTDEHRLGRSAAASRDAAPAGA